MCERAAFWWIVYTQPTQGRAEPISVRAIAPTQRLHQNSESHPREWVDRSSPAYQRRRLDRFSESPPLEWVDRSSPAYRRMPARLLPRIPPTEVGGLEFGH